MKTSMGSRSNRSVPHRIIALAALSWLVCAMPAFAQVVPECGGNLPASTRLPHLVNIVPDHVHVQEAHQKHRLMVDERIGFACLEGHLSGHAPKARGKEQA